MFSFIPNPGVLDAINNAAGSDIADGNDLFAVGHRFVGHGNRDWHTETEEYDVSVGVEGRLTEGLGYDARVSAYRLDGFEFGRTFVHAGRIRSEIQAGNYDLENPFSDAPEHLQAIANSGLRLENDFGGEFLGARLALEGSAFSVGERHAAWTAGFQLGRSQAHDISVYRGNDGMIFNVSHVLGSGGASYSGKRRATAAFGEMSLPLTDNLDLRFGGRGDEYDDVGGLRSWRLGVAYRPSDVITLRSSWSAGDRPPGMWHLYSSEVQDHPYIECDPGTGNPAPLLPGTQPPAGHARDHRQPGARSFGHRSACDRRRGPQRPVLPGCGMVSTVTLRPRGAEQRRLGHAKPE